VPALRFRTTLLLAMMLVVAAVTLTTLSVTQRWVERAYARVSLERFAAEANAFAAVQDARLAGARAAVLGLARSVRLTAALREREPELLYKSAVDELRHVLAPDPDVGALPPASFFRIIDADGVVLPPPAGSRAAPIEDGNAGWQRQLAVAARAASAERAQQIGFLPLLENGQRALDEVIVTPIVDRPRDEVIGALAIGFPAPEPATSSAALVVRGVWVGRRLYTHRLPRAFAAPGARTALRETLRARIPARVAAAAGDLDVRIGGAPYRVFVRPLHEESQLPPAFIVGLYSLDEAQAETARLRRTILRCAALALLLGLVVSVVLSRSLSVPIAALVSATGAVMRGDLGARVPVRRRDELGRLATAFNAMVDGLALKERYRNVLDVITDKSVAQELLDGDIALGGELKDVSVLFCDIRGFTTLTERMSPGEVIALLNEHMTALTGVVHAHHGIVDKFVGDGLMALFGAPRTGGNDARDALTAARAMLAVRRARNTTAQHALDIGIGIASGVVVAGCVGSLQRMNYTVVGERVNLAARLCAAAGRMEILIDDATRTRAADQAAVEAVTIALRGFRAPIAVYRVVDDASLATAS